jgi:hypothetical protein
MVRPEATGFLAAARLDRTSEEFDVLGVFSSVEDAQKAVVEALRTRKVNWQEEGF